MDGLDPLCAFEGPLGVVDVKQHIPTPDPLPSMLFLAKALLLKHVFFLLLPLTISL